jgi:hypothetical protein
MHVSATLGSTERDSEKKEISKENRSQIPYISLVREGASIQPIAMEVCTFV